MTNKREKVSAHYQKVSEEKANQRLDNYLITYLKELPKSRIYRMIRKGEVRVNKKRAAADYRLQCNDVIRIPPLIRKPQIEIKAAPLHLQKALRRCIIFENNQLIIIDKPSGLAVHGGTGSQWGIIDVIKQCFPEEPHLSLVHRLDKDTSGCLMIAKNNATLRECHGLLRDGKVEKIYLGLLKGHWPEQKTQIELPLKKNIMRSGERMVEVAKEGKMAISVIEPVTFYRGATLAQITIHTGRTHQIRVHTSYHQHPLAGDEKYGDRHFNKTLKPLGLRRLFLHAQSLRFNLKNSPQPIVVKAKISEDLKVVLSHLKTLS